MASFITQSISTAAASVAPPTPVAATAKDQTARPVTQEQVQRLSQEASKSVNGNLKTPDSKRSVQIPKRVESPFASQEQKEVKKDLEKTGEEGQSSGQSRPSRAVA